VFTDTTCPFCLKLHQSMPELLKAGITVNYLMYPRDQASIRDDSLSRTAQNMKNIWCSVDQHAALDSAFDGYKVQESDCAALPKELNRKDSPVLDHYMTGALFNVSATPTYFASNGKSDVGFDSAQKLINKVLGQ
jgi:thiol:disulfide interchange protein DsbC